MIRTAIFLPSLLLAGAAALTAPVSARKSVGVFSQWAAFRDDRAAQCYAIAMPDSSRLRRDHEPYATITTRPKQQVRGQIYFRLSREMAKSSAITLQLGDARFQLTGSGGDAWAEDRRMDAAIIAGMRSASSMTIRAVDSRGRRFSNTYRLAGAASAMDAATLACAKLR